MTQLIYKQESYDIIGKCIEVHKNLGKGFLEIVYKDALEYEFNKANMTYNREKQYKVYYKGVILPHKFYADFVVFDKIILEIKSCSGIAAEHVAQTLNYLAVSQNKLGLLVNFGKQTLEYKRLVL